MRHFYGYKRDRLDERDFLWRAHAPRAKKELPEAFSLRDKFPPVYNQGQTSSCVGNAVAAALDVAHMTSTGLLSCTPSRLFLYYFARKMEGTVAEDCGCYIRDAIKVAAKMGSCAEELHPFSEGNVYSEPSADAIENALRFQALEYFRITGLLKNPVDEIREALSEGCPVVCGVMVYESFESEAVSRTGTVPMPDTSSEQLYGGHAIVIVGYDDAKGVFLARNSWGAEWGDKGYFTLPAGFVERKGLTSDIWALRKAE